MSEAQSRKITPFQILALVGMGLGLLVFAGGLMLGISIDPRVDLPSRLLAYTVALGGFTVAMACGWATAEHRAERIIFAVVTIASLASFIGYGLVML